MKPELFISPNKIFKGYEIAGKDIKYWESRYRRFTNRNMYYI